MQVSLVEIGGARCIVAGGDGVLIGNEESARALVEATLNERAAVVVLPVAQIDPAFFQLRSGMAGAFLQKLIQYRRKIAIVGDVSAFVAASDALRDFVVECDRGGDVLFVGDLAALAERLATLAAPTD